MCKNNRRKQKIYIYLYGVEFNNCDYVLKEHQPIKPLTNHPIKP